MTVLRWKFSLSPTYNSTKKYFYWLLEFYSLSWKYKLLWTSRKQQSLRNWEHCRLPCFFIAQLKDYIRGTIPQLQNSLILQGFCASSSGEVHAFIRIVDEVRLTGSRGRGPGLMVRLPGLKVSNGASQDVFYCWFCFFFSDVKKIF